MTRENINRSKQSKRGDNNVATAAGNFYDDNEAATIESKKKCLSPNAKANYQFQISNELQPKPIHMIKRQASVSTKYPSFHGQSNTSFSNRIHGQKTQYVKKEDLILQKLKQQEKELDYQLKQLEKRYSEIESNPQTGINIK